MKFWIGYALSCVFIDATLAIMWLSADEFPDPVSVKGLCFTVFFMSHMIFASGGIYQVWARWGKS